MSTNLGQLIIQIEGNVVQTFSISKPVVVFGRVPGNDITLPHPQVSRNHAELRVEGPRITITDLNSSNGTFVNGEQLLPDQPRVLVTGELFTIGPFSIRYVAPETQEQPSVEVVPDDPAEPPLEDVVPVEPEPLTPIVFAPIEPLPVAPPRPTFAAVLADPASEGYLVDLPVIFQENDFLRRFLLIFASIWEPLELRQDHIELYFDPRTSPRSFLPWLSNWLDISFNRHWPEARIRHLLAEAFELYRWRGTKYGLTRMIEVCTGITPEISDDPVNPMIFHVRMAMPVDTGVDQGLVDDLIRSHKPAHAGYTLEMVS